MYGLQASDLEKVALTYGLRTGETCAYLLEPGGTANANKVNVSGKVIRVQKAGHLC